MKCLLFSPQNAPKYDWRLGSAWTRCGSLQRIADPLGLAGFKWQGYGPRGSDWTEEKGKEERDRRGGKREKE